MVSLVLYVVGILLLGKGVYDFGGAIFGTSTIKDAIDQNVVQEGYIYFIGTVYGFMAAYSKLSMHVRMFVGGWRYSAHA